MQDACVTHHLVLLPGLVEPAMVSESAMKRVLRPQSFSTRITAPPYSPPRSVIV